MTLNATPIRSTPLRAESRPENVTARLGASNLVYPGTFRAQIANSARTCAARAAFHPLPSERRRRPRRCALTLGLCSSRLLGPSDALPELRERAAPPRRLRHAHALEASRPRRPPAEAPLRRSLHAKERQRTQSGRAASFPSQPTLSTPRASRLVQRCQTRPTPEAHPGSLLTLAHAT